MSNGFGFASSHLITELSMLVLKLVMHFSYLWLRRLTFRCRNIRWHTIKCGILLLNNFNTLISSNDDIIVFITNSVCTSFFEPLELLAKCKLMNKHMLLVVKTIAMSENNRARVMKAMRPFFHSMSQVSEK